VISEIPGIKNAKTSIADGIVRIDHQTPDVVEKAKEVIQKEGYVVMT
jgi:copper chaperone CopZ